MANVPTIFPAVESVTIADAENIVLNTTTGSKIGTASTQKLGFLGATPVTRQATTADLKDTLVAFGLIADSGASPLNLDAGAFNCGAATTAALQANAVTCSTISCSTITLGDANNIAGGTSTGTKIGTATNQKLGFFNATPIAKTTLANAILDTSVPTSTTPWGFTSSTQAASIVSLVNEVRALLVALGFAA